MNNSSKKIYLIDGSYYIYRAYHAMQGLARSDGFPTNAIFIFVRMLSKVLRDAKPDYMAIAWDSKVPTFRHEIYKEYKANRPAMPEDLSPQIPYIMKIVDAFRIPVLEKEGYEADDLIGTISRKAEEKSFEVVIVSGDKDMMQLVSDKVSQWDTMKDVIYSPGDVEKKFGVSPDKVVDVLGLMGDASDNVPGVPGIGPKTASELIRQYGSIEGLLAHISDLKGKKREILQAHAEDAVLSKRLVQIDRNVPLDIEPEELVMGAWDKDTLEKLFRELEFSQFLKELTPKKGISFENYRVVRTEAELIDLVDRMKKARQFAIDTETTSIDPMMAELVGISVALAPGEAYYIPVGHRLAGSGEQIDKEKALEILGPLISGEAVAKIGQNIKYDMMVLKSCHNIEINNIKCDTMIASYLIDPTKRSHNLEELSRMYLGHQMITYGELVKSGRKEINFSEVAVDQAAIYSCEDVDVTLRLAKILEPRLREMGLEDLFRDLEMPLVKVLARMEMAGVLVDKALLSRLSLEMGQTMQRMEEEIYEIAGERFNINSHQQLGAILFEKLRLPTVKKTRKRTGYSTDTEVLEQLADKHSLPKKILEYRTISKLKSTYVDALLGLINPKTGRIHTSYNQTVTATGRLSSSDPNLQNIPIRTEEGRKIRQAFIAAPGCWIISADYSQIELRILAHMTGDEVLVEAFKKGADIHVSTASEVFGVLPEMVTPDLRRKAKTINFGIMYGMRAFGLARELGISKTEAQQYLDRYMSRFGGVREYQQKVLEKARKDGYVTTMFGRRRPVHELKSPNRSLREAGERIAINTPIQGSAADLIKKAMISIDRRVEKEALASKMILQVHDELVFEVPEGELDRMKSLIKEEMESAAQLKVPLVVDIHQGRNWDEAH